MKAVSVGWFDPPTRDSPQHSVRGSTFKLALLVHHLVARIGVRIPVLDLRHDADLTQETGWVEAIRADGGWFPEKPEPGLTRRIGMQTNLQGLGQGSTSVTRRWGWQHVGSLRVPHLLDNKTERAIPPKLSQVVLQGWKQ